MADRGAVAAPDSLPSMAAMRRAASIARGAKPSNSACDTTKVTKVPVSHVPGAVDATGAGDVITGAVTVRLVLGDDFQSGAAYRRRCRALSTTGRGGMGRVVTLSDALSLSGVADGTRVPASPTSEERQWEKRQWQA